MRMPWGVARLHLLCLRFSPHPQQKQSYWPIFSFFFTFSSALCSKAKCIDRFSFCRLTPFSSRCDTHSIPCDSIAFLLSASTTTRTTTTRTTTTRTTTNQPQTNHNTPKCQQEQTQRAAKIGVLVCIVFLCVFRKRFASAVGFRCQGGFGGIRYKRKTLFGKTLPAEGEKRIDRDRASIG